MSTPQVVPDQEKPGERVTGSGDDVVGKFETTSEVNTRGSSSSPVKLSEEVVNAEIFDSDDVIIVTGADAAAHLISLRDDLDPSLTFRSLFLSSILACFQAAMHQIYVACISNPRLPSSKLGYPNLWRARQLSSNQPKYLSAVHLSSSSHTFWGTPGLQFFPGVIYWKQDGGQEATQA